MGLAWVNTDLGVILPYGVIENKAKKLAEFVREENIERVVIGLPIGLDNQENENSKRARDFAEKLKDLISVPIEFIDERFTSRQADQMGGEATRDEKAAMLVLENYLQTKKY